MSRSATTKHRNARKFPLSDKDRLKEKDIYFFVFLERLRAVVYSSKRLAVRLLNTETLESLQRATIQVDASLDLLEINRPRLYRTKRFSLLLSSLRLNLRISISSTSMSYAYLFKYIIIGDTGNSFCFFIVCFFSFH